jgi:hypothetical protein
MFFMILSHKNINIIPLIPEIVTIDKNNMEDIIKDVVIQVDHNMYENIFDDILHIIFINRNYFWC